MIWILSGPIAVYERAILPIQPSATTRDLQEAKNETIALTYAIFIVVRQRGQLAVIVLIYLEIWVSSMRAFVVLIGVPMPLRQVDERGIVFSVRFQSRVRGPKVRSYGDGFGRGELCGYLGRWRFPNPFRPCSFCGIQRPSVPWHTGPVWMVMTHCQGTSLGSTIC